MNRNSFWLFILSLAVLAALWGCEGPEGPAGPKGDKGDTGDPYPQYSYLGDAANTCGHCHLGTVDQWSETGHSQAYEHLTAAAQQNNPYCLQCHTVGFDAAVNYGDTVLVDHGSDHSGYDDYWPPQTAQDSARAAKLQAVQCESCHGAMGPTIYNHTPEVSYATANEQGEPVAACAKCHDTQIEEWHDSGHGGVLTRGGITQEEFSAEFNRSDCWTCHTTEGFVMTNDADHSTMTYPEMANLIGCVACHDPHNATNEKQVRTIADESVIYAVNQPATFTGYESAQICVQCHHARRDSTNVTNQIVRGTIRFGPHGSPQMDMFLGSGAYEIAGYNYDRGADNRHRRDDLDACVTCHMTLVMEHNREHRVHKFEPNAQETCSQCHVGTANFDINGVQTEVQALMDTLLARINVAPDSLGSPRLTTMEQRKAAYAYSFVNNDGSKGIHNPAYARSLLNNAIEHLNTLP